MAGRVLLIVNCALDSSYNNRHVLDAMYRDRFDELVFTVSATCGNDPRFPTIAQRWEPPRLPACICSNAELGEHGALRHSFHTRLLAAASLAADFDYVMFAEDDCVISPRWDSRTVRKRCEGWDALAPTIRPCRRDDTSWVWAQHGAGYPAFDAVADRLDHGQLAANWHRYGGMELEPAAEPIMFLGFCDWFIAGRSLFQRMIRDLEILQLLWHEAAIPTAMLHNTPQIGVSNGLPLWGTARDRPLAELMSLLERHDFVHAIKLSQYGPKEILAVYRSI